MHSRQKIGFVSIVFLLTDIFPLPHVLLERLFNDYDPPQLEAWTHKSLIVLWKLMPLPATPKTDRASYFHAI